MSKQLFFKNNITFYLIGIIFLLILLLGFTFYNSLKIQQLEDDRINNTIANFEEKFHADSVNLMKFNKLLIDSISIVYEEKLKSAYKNGYLDLSLPKKETTINNDEIAINKNTTNVIAYSKITAENKNIASALGKKSSNVTSYSKLKNTNYYKPFSESKHSSNVTSYSKLNENGKTNMYSKPKVNTSNVTSYSKLKNNQNNNVTSYSKLKNKTVKPSYDSSKNSTLKKQNNNSNLVYANPKLNAAINIHDIEIPPVFPGCENRTTKKSKKNCLATKISNYVISNFNSKGFSKLNVKKGMNNIRVLFIIDKYGKSEIANVVGEWHPKVKQEVYRTINSIPKMKPGKNNNVATSVKYSFRIPFIVK